MCPSRSCSRSFRVDARSSFVSLARVSSALRCCPFLMNVLQFMSVPKPVRVVRKRVEVSREHGAI